MYARFAIPAAIHVADLRVGNRKASQGEFHGVPDIPKLKRQSSRTVSERLVFVEALEASLAALSGRSNVTPRQ